MSPVQYRRTAVLRGFEPVRVRSAHEAYEHSERRFTRLVHFSFASDDAPHMLSSGPRFQSWSIALVRSTGHRIELGDEDKVSVLFPYRGRIMVARGGADATAGQDELLVVAPGARTTWLSCNYLGVLIQVPVADFEMQLRPRALRRWPALVHFAAGHPAVLAAHAVVGALESRRAPLHDPDDWRRLLAPLLAALGASQHDEARELPASLRHVQAAEQFMAANVHRPLSLPDIASGCHVGPRALQAAFVSHRRSSPLQILKDLRIAQADAMLRASPKPLSITRVALECGFTHLGRFSVDYRRANGETPSGTRRKARATP